LLRGLKSGRARQGAEFETDLVQRFLDLPFDIEEIGPEEFAIRTQPVAIEYLVKQFLALAGICHAPAAPDAEGNGYPGRIVDLAHPFQHRASRHADLLSSTSLKGGKLYGDER
jgi:hypothetical protein